MGITNDKMEVSVLCVPGINEKLIDNFYINGRSREWLDSSIINIVMENTIADGIFAVTSSMDSDPSKGSSISLVKDIKHFQNQHENSGGDIESKTLLLREQIATTNNYLYSLNLARISEGDEERMAEGSTAVAYIEDDHYSLLTTGNAKAFIYSNGIAKQLTNSRLKIEKLVKLGVMTEEQAKGLNTKDDEDGITQHTVASLSSGDCLVLCAGKSADFIDEDKLSGAFYSNTGNALRLTDLMREAVSQGIDDDLTIMVIKAGTSELYEDAFFDDFEDESELNISKYMATIFAVVLAFVIGLAGGWKVLPFFFGNGSNQTSKEVKATEAPDVIKTEEPFERSETEAPTNKTVTPTEKPTAKPTKEPVQATSKPTTAPTKAPESEVTTSDGQRIYTVQPNDSLASIAVKFYNKYSYFKKIADANDIKEPYIVNVGQKLIIPDVN